MTPNNSSRSIRGLETLLKYSVMQLLLYLSLRYSTTKPDAKKREIIANLLTYPSEVSSMGSIFLGDEQTITTEGDTRTRQTEEEENNETR